MGYFLIISTIILFILFLILGVDLSYGSVYFLILAIMVCSTSLFLFYKLITLKKTEDKQSKSKKENKTENKEVLSTKKIKYYDIEGRPGYCFCEYDDRYELYKKTNKGLVYIKTDYKKGDL